VPFSFLICTIGVSLIFLDKYTDNDSSKTAHCIHTNPPFHIVLNDPNVKSHKYTHPLELRPSNSYSTMHRVNASTVSLLGGACIQRGGRYPVRRIQKIHCGSLEEHRNTDWRLERSVKVMSLLTPTLNYLPHGGSSKTLPCFLFLENIPDGIKK